MSFPDAANKANEEGMFVLTIFWNVGTQRKLSLWRWHIEVI